jgi:amino acid adenylation domain-containing protein
LSEIERLATAVGLSARQRELLASLLAEEGIDLGGEPPITPLHGQGDLQLSFSQQRLWFLQRLEPESPFYNIAVEVRLAGALDIPVLGRALAEVMRRHETLRVAFVELEGEPRVRVAAPGPVHLPLVDLSGLPAAEVRRLAGDLTLDEARRGFDLAAGALLRVLLLKVDRREHKVVLTLHHIAADGWSLGVLVQEVGALYGAFLRGGRSPLPELPFQYADYAAWQRSWLQGEILEKELAHWRAKLEGADPVLALPFDHPRPALRSDRGATRILVLPAELAQGVEQLSRREGVSLFMTLLAAFLALLERYTGQQDLVIGYPVANRDRSDIEGLIGVFLNTLVLRVDLSSDPPVRALLGRVRDEVLDAQSHAQLPFERLVEELRVERSLSYNPVFQVLFVLQNTPASELEIPGLAVETAIVDLAIAQFDLSCRFEKSGDTLLGRLEYSRDLFDGTTIERLAGGFGRLLAAAVADPGRRLSELPLLSEAELHQTAREWSDSGRAWEDWDGERICLPQLCEAQAARSPRAPALTFGEETLSYAELHRRANRLAHRLRRMGIGPEARVGVLLERSAEMVVALLGILKAGGAYVPLDPAFPAERLAWMAGDAGLAALLTDERLAGSLAVPPACPVLKLDLERRSLAGESEADPAAWAVADNLAYVLYTSGSTGRPKGVAVPHRALVNLLASIRERPGLTAGDTLLAVTTISFDIAVVEIFLPLVVGARMVLARPEEAAEGAALARLIARSGATVLQATPATWQMLLSGGEAALAPLRGICGGEALAPGLAAELAARTRSFWNLYGPTETTVWSTAQLVDGGGGTVPIGRPIANTRAVLLDGAGGPVPLGAAGHLHLGGSGVARGYLHRPELTAERFVPDPLSAEPGARLYRTGDLARFLADGTLEYLGRGDQQVKLRGFRIELGEIEAAIRQHPGVREAAVVLLDGTGNVEDRALAAYVVGDEDGAPAVGDLRSFLQGRLPSYMLPSFFTALPRLPLTPSGKVDRKALVAKGRQGGEAEPGRAPRTPMEKLLAEIFAEILKLERVGADDNFFELGGHSLLATQVISRLRAAIGVELPLRVLFARPVLSELARFLESQSTVEIGAAAEPLLPRSPVLAPEALPLSFSQQRLWFLDQLEPGNSTYNIPIEVELRGRLNVAVLAAAFAEVMRRHEALRTTFHMVEGEPAQVVAEPAEWSLPVIDLRALPGRERKQETARLRAAEMRWSFDLERGPLLRSLLLRFGAVQHRMLVTMHHIVSDGWSMGVLVREIGVLYPAFLAGAPSPLPELAMQYPAFASWQRRHLSGELLSSELAWWRGQLAGMPPVLELPADHPRPAVFSGRGGEHAFVLKAESLAGLNRLSRQHGATLFMTLLAGFLGLLQRYTGEDDLAVGTPIAGRNRVEIEPLIGLFVNTLVLRVDLAGDPEVASLLERVRETTLSVYAHQEVPFERLVETLARDRDQSRPPLVQVLFVFQNAPLGALELPGLALKTHPMPTETTKVELTCMFTEVEGVLEGRLEYSRDLFDSSTMERLAGHLTRLLAGAVEAPRRRLSELPLLSETERRQLLDWNAAAPEMRGETTLTALFEAQVRRVPEEPAVSFEDDTLSYDELNRRANRLARHLRRLGVGPESLVGVLLERSLEQVVGLLGILKAGGAYVPFDPSAPAQRLAFLCADSGIQVLVTDGREELPPVATVVRLGGLEEEELEEDDRDLPALTGPDHLCYVIYTSGSTGLPKGVQVRHGSVARLLSATAGWFGFGPADVWTLFHSYSFDFSVWELWGALAYGGRLVVVPYWVSRSPEAFWWLLVEEGVTVLNQTPSAFRQLIQADGEMTAVERAGLALRLVIFGGEALDLGSLGPWYERHAPGAPRLVNMYGITETTVHVSYRPLDVADLAAAHRSPIGVAIPDLGLRLLDARLELVPVGVTGEICVGGAGLARGYLSRPELTAERFVPDPFSREPGERLYRSGDLARYRPDGDLDYLGRRDQQVKVRGFRIELGEIEAALLAHGGVRSAIVLPRQDSSGSGSLVAYVETTGGGVSGEVSAGGLQELLRGRLPEYMVPAAFVLLKSMPLTVNGKLDRKALASLPLEPGERRDADVAPRTPTEELVAGIFAEVLTLERVGPAADFFALGGHSLLATQVASRVRTVFGLELGVRAVFETPTVEGLASRIERQLAEIGLVPPAPPDPPDPLGPPDPPNDGARGALEPEASGEKPSHDRPAQGLPAIVRVPREGRQELSFAQQRLWFLDQLEPGSTLYNIPVAVRLTGDLNQAALAATLAEIVRRHEVLRATFQVMDGKPVQVFAARAEPGLPLIDLRLLPAGKREEEASRLAVAEARRPFDLACGPLLRVTLLEMGGEQHVVLLTMHHIVSDGWSSGVLVRELGTLYAAFLAGAPSPLPELAVQYADFVSWQRERLSGGLLESELAWWHGQLAGMPPALELPTDHPRPATQSPRGAARGFALEGEDLAGLRRLSRGHGTTLFMTLLAGFMGLLQRYTGADDLVVGTPIAGRIRGEVEPLIGLFVNTLALRVDLSGDPEIVMLLERVREVTLSAYAHQEVPFERLVEDLAPERDLSRPPLAQVFFSVQNAPAGTLELPGLALEASSVPTETAKFELTCTLMETEGGLAGGIEYGRDLFEATTIERLARHFTRLLTGMAAAGPRRRLSELPLLSTGERHQILGEWNETLSASLPAATVVDLFVRRAAEGPDRPAVVEGSRGVTYGELAERSERLAGWLARQGVGPECVVALVAPRSAALVVATVGIARCGAAFLPLDPAHPPARLQDLLRGSGARLALIGPGVEIPGFASAAPTGAPLPLVAIDGEAWEAETDGAPVRRIEPAQLAYVIYTSGSTGEPKGVMVSHAALLNLVGWHLRAHGLTAEDRCTLAASPAFDASVWEMWPALCAGAALRVVNEETRLAPGRLLDLLATDGTTIGFLPTPLAERAMELEPPAGMALRTLLTGGDRLRRVPSGLPYSVGNHYGPTEAAVVSTWTSVEAGSERPPAIGRPIDQTRAYVLDRLGGPVPAGVAGELYVAGASLARGYLGRPELTADAFRPDPFAGAGERLYRTGDRVRWRVDGELEFLGRIDHQIKLRGVRIEPAEIEAALARHPAVSEAAVLVLEDEAGEKRLVAFVMPLANQAAEPAPSSADLQGVLRRSLPESMVPSAFVILESLPLTANGKVDRLALSRIGKGSVRETTRFTAPRGPIEERIAEIWTEVLGAEQVGAHDDFFSLGGHSLLATQVISRVREAFKVEMPLRSLFESPTVAELAGRIEGQLAGWPAGQPPPVVPLPREGRLDLSFAQQRLWFLDQLEPGSATYNIPAAVRLTGDLDRTALAATFTEIVRRHEVLRTTFQAVAGEPVQVISPPGQLPLPLIDLRALPPAARGGEVERLAGEAARLPFDLARDPLLRALLLALTGEEHIALVTLHHIASDGWSIGVLMRELTALYAAFREGAPSPLPELAIQYADYAGWQRRLLSGERLETDLGFWRQRLAGAPRALELPTDRPRLAGGSQPGAIHEVSLDGMRLDQLIDLSRRHESTLFMVLLAAFAVLLERYSGQEDLIVGTPIAGRTRLEAEPLIGLFVNTLALRIDLSGAPGFLDLLGRVREMAFSAYAHQELPFERLVEELAPERDLSRTPLVQVMLALQNAPAGPLTLPGLELQASPLGMGAAAAFELTLTFAETSTGTGRALGGSIEYRRDLFDASTVERLAGHFERLLADAVAAPGKRTADLLLLSEAERHELLVEWGASPGQPHRPTTLDALFTLQVERAPDAVAVVFGGERLTYRDLDARVDRWARHLERFGVGPETVVGVCLEPSPDLVAALFAIWRAGGAFLPLDPAYPEERLAFMLEDSGAPLALTRGGVMSFSVPGVRRILLDELAEDVIAGGAMRVATRPEDLAYIIYTSGSTGRPKGVAVQQREAADHIETVVAAWELGSADRVLQFASPSFDTWIEETVPPLVSGAALVLRGTELWEPSRLLARIRELGLTVIELPTAYWLQWVREGLGEETPEAAPAGLALRLVWPGGEAMSTEGARLWWRSPLRGVRLVNSYGPTEAVITATICEVDAALAAAASVPLGQPLSGRSAHVLDRGGHLLPAGVPGELCLGGVLARGYLRRPDLTAERFVPDPFSTVPGGRLYRTGDLARYLAGRVPAGRLEYLGRIDQQVKVRGFRIELGEIEAALLGHDRVRAAVVLARADASGGGSLVAYVETARGAVSAAELRELLARRLPEHMVPAIYGFLESMPLTPNGKVDRRALAAMPLERGEVGDGGAPRTPVEELVAGIFAEVLRLERVGVEDNFFELGGHSLLATQVASRVRSVFGVELALRAVFEAPTVAALAGRIEPALAGRPAEGLPAITRASREGRLELSFAQQRLWFLDRLAPDNPFYNMYGEVRLTGLLDVEALRRAFQEIVRRHEGLRTTFRLVAGRPVQAIDPMLSLPVPLIDLEAGVPEREARAELARLSNDENLRPFDLARGPLLRAYLVRLGPREHALLVNIHHIVSDGWSMGVLFRELATLYGAFAEGAPSPLPELPIQYADFAVWQREWLRGERLEAELAYWRRQLAGIPEALELPFDHPRPAIESFRGGIQSFALPAELVRALTALTRRHGATPSMTMLAGFTALLGRYSGREDIAVGIAIANRTRREVEGLIGFFVNTLVSRTDLSGSPGFARLLARTRETALAAYAHQELPFERLVEELQPERDLSRNPLIQVMFGYQNFPQSEVEVRGLTLSPPEHGQVTARTAKFDLTLFLFEEGDRLTGSLEYNSELFEAMTLQRLAGHFENLLAAAVAQPETAVALLPLMSEAERHQLAREWNDTDSVYPAAASLQELFEEQVRRAPGASALLFDGGEISYGELNRRANWLAARLRRLGVGPESRVGLSLVRSPELVVGMLGILKAGGAYVPLDPDYPGERLGLMMEDSGLRVLVSKEPAVTRLPGDLLARMELVLPEDGLTELDDDPPVTTTGGSLAHVIYTSGSTGRPKGVGIPHSAVARLVRGIGYADLGPDQVFSQFAPISFDPSTFEIWGALLNGSRLALAPPHALSLEELGQAIERYRITTLWLTTVLFHQFVEHRLDLLRPVPQILAGGDALSPSHVRKVLAELPGTRLVNGYGPTENSTFTCCYTMQGPEPIGSSTPLGRPIANTQVHLLDPHGQPVPIGVAGELCTGGGGLARGYLGRPELTAERFVPNPFGGTGREAPGSRLYRTGDLARYFPDGRVEFLGRIDHQVKIRGFRIELGEIESRLGEHPAVLRSVVLAREDMPGDRRLVAYVVQNPAYEALESSEQAAQVSQWSELFDDLYRQQAAGADPTFNIVGWNSTYTDLPLPGGEMEEWLEDTIGRIAALEPRRVLEIGCGTGMILFRIAPLCELYTGTDISGRALEYIESQLGRVDLPGIDRSRVRLLQRSAEQLDGLAAGSFDTVILNSVAQYFPSADYLAEVVARLVEVVRPGGSIFLGDLRSLPLLEVFHTSLELFQAEEEMPLPRLRQKVQARDAQESELVIDPAFFAALRQRLPGLGRVEVYPKRGRAHNELTGFRYQVVLRVGGEAGEPAAVSWLDWRETGLTLATLRRHLEESRPAALGLRNVPNARVAAAGAAVRLLREPQEGIETAGDLRRRAVEAAAGAVEPQDLWDLSLELPYEVELSWASPGSAGGYEVVLRRRGAEAGAIAALLPVPEMTVAAPLGRYTSNPLQGRFARRIAPELRAFLTARLPEYMVPSAFVLLDALPLSPSGKLDRRRLPAPDLARPETGSSLVAPRNAVEARLVEIWRELLGIERIGVDDDFFELGGHSLLATQAVSRVREAFGVELPLRVFFEATTVAAVAEKVEELRLAEGGDDVPPIVAVPRNGLLPLSFSQERLWFLQRLETRTLAYNEAAAFRMAGRLDVAALRWSLDEVLRRHESLRTTFPEVDGRAVQIIQPPAPFEIPVADLRGLPAAARDAEAHRLALGQALRPFDLERGPLERGLLVRLGEKEHAVVFSFHHIVFDGWSMGIFARELSALYGARIAGAPSPLPPLAIQYADFASWQRRWLRGEVLERQLAYWRERLAGIAALGLATDRPRPVLPQAPSGHRFVVVPPALTQRLRELGRGRSATLFMTLLAAFQALLHRYTGQDDVAIGTPIANRGRGEVEALIGFFVNMLVLRTDLSGDPSFGELLDRVRQVALGAYTHQSLPFEKLVEELRPDRDLRRTPLFQVSFQLLNVPASSLDLAGLSLHPWDFAPSSAKFDLDLALIDSGEGLNGLLDYDADLFDGATMERLLGHLDRLLTGAVESPGRRLSELPLLTPAEHGQVVEEWNDTRAAFPSELRLQELFEAQARRTPAAVALQLEGEELRYDELNARANRLAHRLRRWGVGPGVRVGLCLERSPEMVVGLLGVLKAGGAYVPLDPSYPPERLAFMLADARVPVLLVQERLLATIQSEEGSAAAPRVLCLDTQWEEVAGESAEDPAVLGGAGELAYVIYTSGSTGRPKGAMNSHRAIVNRLLWMQQAYGLTSDDRVLQKTPFSFDVSVWELFWPLATGARLVLARPGGHQDPDYLVRLIREAGITTAHFVPSMLQVFLDAQAVESCTSLGRVICSGEALTAPLARRFFSRFPAGAELHNLYGPTEAAVDVTAWRCEPAGSLAAVPIGRPIANTSALVLDAHLAAVPIGVPGELYLGGVQLARGYLDRPDLTAERFVPDPFAAPGGEGGRLYRTGDQVRRLSGGEIVYLGRLDHQVKVRGFRIELGEVESALSSLAGVGEAVVTAREDAPGDLRLVAYVTGEATVEELRRQLRERLPEFMVPATFVPLAALPLTPNGKVDRKALPAPDRGPAPGFVAPRTPAEEILAEIWAEVLGRERVGLLDSFFDLGGHSLLAAVLMARIEKRFGKALPLAILFTAPNLEALAAFVDRSGGQARRSPLVAIKPQGERAPLFCVHPVGGNVLCYLDLARHLAPDQPLYALQTPGPGEGGALSAGVEEMAARYLRELRRVQPYGPYRLGGWSMGGLVAFEMARQLEREGEETELLALIDTLPPAAGPALPATEEELVAWFLQDLARLLGRDVGVLPEQLHRLSTEEKLEWAAGLAHAEGLLPRDFGLEQMKPLLAVFAANTQAGRAFVRRTYAGRATLYLSEQTLSTYGPEILDGWERSALGGTEVATLPGDHYSLLRRPQVARLAEELTARLAAAAAKLPVS